MNATRLEMIALGCTVFAIAACGPRVIVPTRTAPATTTTTYALESVGQTIGLQRDAGIAALLTDIDPVHIRHSDSILVSFGTRNTFSDTLSKTHGIGAARRWIYSEFEQDSRDCGGCLRVTYYGDVQKMGRAADREANVVDVLAWLPGRDTTHVVVITGHYDSCICSLGGTYDSVSTAPGADDDGSGTSAIMELARVVSKHYPHGLQSSIIFAAVAAEEQGLYGSKELAQHLHDAGYQVIAGMTDDIVGNVTAEDGTTDSTSMRIFAADPDNSPSRDLGRYVWGLDGLYLPNFTVLPVWRLDRIGRGGDHEPYVDLGDAGLRFTERIENYNRQHLPTDDFAHVNFGYVANVARVNAMTVASLASAPPAPTDARARRQSRALDANGNVTASSSGGQAWTLSWEPSPGATSYELLVRQTTSPTWEQIIPLGNVTTCSLHRQLDDEWAGVRAVGPSGARSIVASIPGPRPPRQPARTTVAGATTQPPGSPSVAPQRTPGQFAGQLRQPSPPNCGG